MLRTSLFAAALLASTSAYAATYTMTVSDILPANNGVFNDYVSNCFNCDVTPYDPQGMWVFNQAGIFDHTVPNYSVQPANGGTYLSVYGTADLYLFPSVYKNATGVRFVLGTDDAYNAFNFGDISINGETIAPFTPDPSLQGARDVLVTITGLSPFSEIGFNDHHQFALEVNDIDILHSGSIDPPGGGGSSPVPEPSTWVMMGLGFAFLGYAALDKRAKRARIEVR